MDNIGQILNLLPEELKNYMGVDVIESDSVEETPIYPFLTYKVINAVIPDRFMPILTTKVVDSPEAEFEKDIEMSYINNLITVIRIIAHELKPASPMSMAIKARKFFETPQMFPRTIGDYGVVKEVTVIQAKDSLLATEADMEFDVKIEWEHVTTVTERTIESVEVTSFNDTKIYDI